MLAGIVRYDDRESKVSSSRPTPIIGLLELVLFLVQRAKRLHDL